MTLFRSKAPLRIGFAGGGTDVSPYCDLYGGSILNATISLYAYANIEILAEETIILEAADRGETETYPLLHELPINNKLDLLKGVYNRVVKDYGPIKKGFKLTTYVDAPAGSGLGTSSTLVVAIVGVFAEMLSLPLGEYDIAHYAYEIERTDLKLAGGKQDQYAATFGGVNFMEFYADDKVIVNPLRIRQEYMNELENNLLLFFTSTSRDSASIIEEQQKNVRVKDAGSIEAMHNLKDQALMMKEAMLKGKIHSIGEILDYGFREKRKMALNISNQTVENIYNTALKAGSTGGKISGAGGGGFMIFYCPGTSRFKVADALSYTGGIVRQYNFSKEGVITWRARV